MTVVVANAGPEAAAGVRVSVPRPEGVVYEGGRESTATQGDFAAYGDRLWRVGELAAGESAELTVRYFTLAAGGFGQYAEVADSDTPDPDSEPGNGEAPLAREDDEAYADIGGAAASGAQLRVSPNPARRAESLTLHFDVTRARELEVLVADLDGRVVQRTTFALRPGYQELELPLDALSPGVYLVSLPSLTTAPTRLIVR